ncbi:ANTAR domain-containing protein [Terrabacter sp. 2YAF2]|uniref:ANTAR domain-containing protein n=1 Tax=Terrabacter sp. 2YAF2 TaxID=3233026 RepID=UPI003F9513B8
MATESPDAERQWAAEKRDFVGDRRDDLAGERDLAGDLRDLTADAREQALDKRERELDAREAQLGLARQAEATAHRLDALAIRGQARQTRERSGAERVAAARARDDATQRRLEAAPIMGLASAFATIAANLYAADSYDAVLQRIAEAAVSTVAGCEMASVTLSEHGGYRTASTTDVAASAVDQAQYDAREGPCLDAVETTLVYAKSLPDNRWPTLASRPVDLGAHSVASYRLAAASEGSAGTSGSLNTYGIKPDAFSDEAQQIGLLLAAHASMAAGAVRERDALQDVAEHLHQALLTRDVIGQAKGILMERLKLTPEAAFNILRHASNALNEKLHDVALNLAETGDLDTPAQRRADRHS